MKLKDACSLEGKHGKPRQHIKKQRHHCASEGPYSQSYGFPVIMFGCESWIVKKTEHQRIDAFELWCWRSLLKVPWTARRSNQSILKEITGRTDAEALILWPPYEKSWLIGKVADAGKIEGKRRSMWQRMRRLYSISDSMDMNLSKLQEMVKDREAWHSAIHGVERVWHDLVTTQQ